MKKMFWVALMVLMLCASIVFGQTGVLIEKQAWVSVGQIRTSGTFPSCQRYDLSKLTATLITDQLLANPRFRVFGNEQVAELRIAGEITSCSISISQVLFVTNVTIKFALNLTATDIITSEKIISETIEGETTQTGLSLIASFVSESDFKNAIEGVLKEKLPKLFSTRQIQSYYTHAPDERALPRQPQNATATTPTTQPATNLASSQSADTSVNATLMNMFNALKGMDFASLNKQLTDDLFSLSSQERLSAQVNEDNKALLSKLVYVVQGVQNFQNIYAVVDIIVIIPSKTGNSITKNLKLGVVNTVGGFSSAFPTRANQGYKVLYLTKENPYRIALNATFPIFTTSSDAVEQMFSSVLAELGISL